MQILPIYSTNYNNQKRISFTSQLAQVSKAGVLKRESSVLVEDFLHRFREILEVLERKTPEGIEKIMQNFPDITIGDNLIFHNCGENKNSIVIKMPVSPKYRGLTYMSKRQAGSDSKYKNVLNSFMLDGKDRLVSNFNVRSSNSFPKDREYFSQEDIEKLNAEKDLTELLNDLDPVMLNFRKFLMRSMNEDLKSPDGRIDYTLSSKLNKALSICSDIQQKCNSLPPKRVLAIYENFPDYKTQSGLKAIRFQNLGNNNVSIYFTEYDDVNGNNLRRLYVYDKDNNPIRIFLIVNNEKFVKNLNQRNLQALPDKFIYADSEEIESDYLPEFNKYFDLYLNKLNEYQMHVQKNYDALTKDESAGMFPIYSSELLSEVFDWYTLAKIKLRKLPQLLSSKVRTEVTKVEPTVGQTGLWVKDDENKRIIQFLPLNNKNYENLVRIIVKNTESGEKQDFLIHEFKYIVKNYNPEYPTIIPKFLKYANEMEMNEINLDSVFRCLKQKSEELARKADDAYEKREELMRNEKEKERIARKKEREKEKERIARKKEREKEKLKQKGILGLKEYQDLVVECKKQLNKSFKTLNNGVEEFNKTIQEIQEKINNFYNLQKE